ncbi:MAG: helix-turn-helix domain-containing protein [Acetatifactor sp.]|nr:helix-turn-helix domain-containing protein [Acetatifactor sp.]
MIGQERNIKQAECLKGLRLDIGLNQREMSEKLGIPLRTWEDWESGRRTMPDYQLRMMLYYIRLTITTSNGSVHGHSSVIRDEKGHPIVIINDIRFMGRQGINWKDVEEYLWQYVGESFEILETADIVYVGDDFPNELKGSNDTIRLKGAQAKAKANATTKVPLLLKYATNRRWQENFKTKHGTDAKYGWYRFTSRFALPVYSENGSLEHYNIFRIEMLIRHASDDKLYLYDMVNIKKETGTPSQQ